MTVKEEARDVIMHSMRRPTASFSSSVIGYAGMNVEMGLEEVRDDLDLGLGLSFGTSSSM